MADLRGSGAIMGATAPEIGHALLQTVAVFTSDAGQCVYIIFSSLGVALRRLVLKARFASAATNITVAATDITVALVNTTVPPANIADRGASREP